MGVPEPLKDNPLYAIKCPGWAAAGLCVSDRDRYAFWLDNCQKSCMEACEGPIDAVVTGPAFKDLVNYCIVNGASERLKDWNTSLVEDMSMAFDSQTGFNEDISSWNTAR